MLKATKKIDTGAPWTLADIFSDTETGGLMTLNAYYSIICLKYISWNFTNFVEKDF